MSLTSRAAIVASIIALTTLLTDCTGGERATGGVPLPTGYPRIAVPDSTYKTAPTNNLHLEINEATRVVSDSVLPGGSKWLTIEYNDFPEAHLFLTVTPMSETVLANRRERMALNSAGLPTEMITVERADRGGVAEIHVTPQGCATPVQFLAIARGQVVSGALLLEEATTKADSVRPIVESVLRDFIHTAKTLR